MKGRSNTGALLAGNKRHWPAIAHEHY
jgi:hypothetical protein